MSKPDKYDIFETLVEETGTCWIYKYNKNSAGYGIIDVSGKKIRVHRLAWTIYKGPIGKGMCILHRCDNPPCCNPDHLFEGTRADNIADMDRKGRRRTGNQYTTERNTMKGELKTTTIRLPVEKMKALRHIAIERDISIGKAIEQALDVWMNERTSKLVSESESL